jgi:hypothetical protein
MGFHFLFRFVNQSLKVVFSMYILTVFSIRIYQFNILGLGFELSDFLFFLCKRLLRLGRIQLLVLVLVVHFDSIEQLKLVLVFPHFIIN